MSEDARLLTILAIILNLEILFELRGEWNEEWFDGFVVSGFVFFVRQVSGRSAKMAMEGLRKLSN